MVRFLYESNRQMPLEGEKQILKELKKTTQEEKNLVEKP